jgi:hypothetical protein
MNRTDQERLVNAVLTGDEVGDLRANSLARGLKELRRQRHRRTLGLAALACLPVALVLALALEESRRDRYLPHVRQIIVAQTGSAPSNGLTTERRGSGVGSTQLTTRVITDDELFALFPGRALALVGPPGSQQLIFLDRQAN